MMIIWSGEFIIFLKSIINDENKNYVRSELEWRWSVDEQWLMITGFLDLFAMLWLV